MNVTAPQLSTLLFKRQNLFFLILAILLHLFVLFNLEQHNSTAIVKMEPNPIAVQFKDLSEQAQTKEQDNNTEPVPQVAPVPKKIAHARKSVIPAEPPIPQPVENTVVDLTDSFSPIVISKPVETNTDMKPETNPEVGPETKPEIKPEIKPEAAAQSKTDAKADEATPPSTKDTISSDGPQTYPVRPPQTGKISMRIVRTEANRNPVYGDGEIDWEFRAGRYKMSIGASLDLLLTSVNLYQLDSEGSIDVYGITPTTSTEKRRTRSETATHFDHANKSVSFSSSNKTVDVQDGVQDKASFIMQLAGIAYADPGKFQAGREIRLQVAEERDVSTFVFIVTALEEVDTKMGKIMAWHIVRPPLPGSYNSKLEIWLAPEQHWYPIQIRNTESNGAITTQTATNIISIPNLER